MKFAPKIGTFLFVFFCAGILSAQEVDTVYTKIAEFAGPFKAFTTDKLQQVYGLTPKNELIKYDNKGQEVFRYNNNYLGKLDLVDVTNPFNLLLFYPDYQTAITLDRTLSETGQINFINLGYTRIPAIGLSNDNNIWLYDDFTFQLKKINANGDVLARSDNLSLLLPSPPQPQRIVARDNRVYLSDPGQGLLVFDNFGQYVQTINIKGYEYFQVRLEQILFQKEGQLFSFHLKALTTNPVPLPVAVSAQGPIRVQKDRMYVLEGEGVKVFKFRF